jgi:hypothetical protein
VATMMTSSQVDYNGLVLDDRISGRVYYDPAIYQEELEKIWHREWVYVAHESEVPQPGDYVTRNIGAQPVIVSSDEDGKVHLLLNRCMHRGNTVCQSDCGNSHAFRCATTDGLTTIAAIWSACPMRVATTSRSARRSSA